LGRTNEGSTGLLSEAECVILVSLAGIVLGYRLAVSRFNKTSFARGAVNGKDWTFSAVVAVGFAFWLVGTVSLTYWQVFVIADRTNETLMKNMAALGPVYTTFFMLGQLIQPLGVIILAYAYGAYRRRFLTAIILAVTFVQIVLGFVADYKSEAMMVGIIVIITKIYIDGRLPKGWLLGAGIFILLAFPIFQAQRLAVRGEQGVSAAEVLGNITETLKKSIAAEDKVSSGFGGADYRVLSFWERASLKGSVELIVTKTGRESPYQMGATLTPILAAFIPRIVWSGKEGLAVGQIFNKTFHISEVADVYISPSHVGEIYWNFGWAGSLLVMPAIGLLLGFVGARCIAYPVLSVTRMMIMFVTIFSLVVHAEGSFATEYVVWLRSIAMIGLLHLVFARPRSTSDLADMQIYESATPARQILRFDNLLR
jgi:hypothetical protein